MNNRWRTAAFITLGAFGIVVADTLILRYRLSKLRALMAQSAPEYSCRDCGVRPVGYRHCVPNAIGDDFDVYCKDCDKKRFPNRQRGI